MHSAPRAEFRSARPIYALCLLALLGTGACAAAQPSGEAYPRTAIEIRGASGRQWFNVVIADTAARQELGLMFVHSLPSDAGMLFPQREPQLMSMWMKNTLIPLDMLFIDARGRIVCLLEKAKPQSLDILSCDKPVKAVLEINGGEAHKRGIKVGDRVTPWPPPQADAAR
jgi:uncharacterized membrane protein (UPF0127 family)